MIRKMLLGILISLAICTNASYAIDDNFTIVEDSVEVPMVAENDSEQELSSQLHDMDTRANGWSAWSEWSSCSRSCDGGVSHQLRTCQKGSCKGEHIRYKICNMQPCPDSNDFRDDQCAVFNSQLYEGSLYNWYAYYDDQNPCTLTCKGKSITSDEEMLDEPVLVMVKLAEKVHDGTRCRPGSLDMCIDGQCKTVGCDLRINSDLQVDACGVCGGDGSSCSRPLYHWSLTSSSLCSQICGGGYKMSRAICLNRVTGEEVEEQLCNISQKPNGTRVECNTHNCPPKWHTNEWGPCSASCGGGSRIRQVHCIEETNSTKIKVNEAKCTGHKPRFQEACNQIDCPKWHTSQWSGCSMSCGEGVQIRVVECRDFKDELSDLCSLHTKPTQTKPCSTGIQCPFTLDEHSDELMPGLYHTQPLMQPYPPPRPAIAERLIGEQVVPSESTFIPDEWGPCSVSCGEGVRKRQVHCRIFLEFSRTIAKLPDNKCSGPKPPETERCFMEPCSSERIDIKDDPYRHESSRLGSTSYSWVTEGYTQCSATCLGGVQELIVNCVRDDTKKIASPYLCPIDQKPEVIVLECNVFPCPPRWNFSDFTPCSQSCGIGIQTREVNCIHEVTHGGANTVVVPNRECPQPAPTDRQYCNVLDCPVGWSLSEWSKCSKPCGTGEKTRKVECKQVMAQNHSLVRPSSSCSKPKPSEKKPCNTKSCVLESDKPHIDVSNTTYIQHSVKKKKVFLKIGGAASVFFGTVVKIKCPVKRFNRTKIQWTKDHSPLPKTKKFRVSKKGALRIQNVAYVDKGVYTCIAGKSSADLALSVQPKPGEFMHSEEIMRQSGYKNERAGGYHLAGVQPRIDDTNPVLNNDDHSHEQRPDLLKHPRTSPKTRLFPPTSPSLRMDPNSLNGWSPDVTLDPEHEQSPSSVDYVKPHVYVVENTASSGSRAMPHFQRLISNLQRLWPFQTFSNSRGHRMVAYPENDNQDDAVDDSIVVLGRGPADNVKFEWVVSEWSKCSQSCGNGIQIRTANCLVRLNNNTQDVDNNLCQDAGLSTPSTARKCGMDECPEWVTSDWSPCLKSKCFALNIAIQRRSVKCKVYNTTVSPSKCNIFEKPMYRQECENRKCVGKWKVGPWSECKASCGTQGVKYRILQCVWYGTKKPAGMACKDKPRPPVMKSCKGQPCTKAFPVTDERCQDVSLFCSNVKLMNICYLSSYNRTCCKTCSKNGSLRR